MEINRDILYNVEKVERGVKGLELDIKVDKLRIVFYYKVGITLLVTDP